MKPKSKARANAESYLLGMLGNAIYAVGLNLIIMPYSLFSGSLTGIAQIIRALLVEVLHLPFPPTLNLVGIILMLLNVPLLLLAYKEISRHFFVKTVVIILFQTLIISLIPIPQKPLIDNILTASIVGGLVCGFGAGVTLRAGASGGGTDILGIYLTKKFPGFSVGKITMIIGAFVFAYCLLRYDLNVVVYSAIYTVIYSFSVDRVHYQNIKTSAMIFTKKQDVLDIITQKLQRGATCWNGYGAYNRSEPTFIYMTVISKYEVARLRRMVKAEDPQAFIIFNDRMNVEGNFVTRLVEDDDN